MVTLAGYLFLSGALLFLINAAGAIGNGGVIRLNNNVLNDIEAGALSPVASWIVMIALVALAGAMTFLRDRRRRVNGLVAPPQSITLLKIGAMAVAGVVVVLIGNTNRGTLLLAVRGLPWVVLVVLGVLVIYTTLLGRTRFGRYIYAIGGSNEAARRAGVNTNRIRVLAFALCGLTAGHHRHHLRLLPGVDLQRRQRRPERAERGGGGGHRRHQPVRRPGEDAGRGARRAGRGRYRQRPPAPRA